MTETICPTCGAKCISNPKYRDDYSAIPQPDLTKLRKAWKSGTTLEVMEAVKELLEQEGK